MKSIFKRILAGTLAAASVLTSVPLTLAAEEDNEASSATLKIGDKLTIKDHGAVPTPLLQNGTRLMMWKSFTTLSDGTTAAAYCMDHTKSNPGSGGMPYTITGRPESAQLMGIVAAGSERNTLASFMGVWGPGGSKVSETGGFGADIGGLTEDEYFYASQAAIWAAMGDTSIPAFSHNGKSYPSSSSLGYPTQRTGKELTANTPEGYRTLICAISMLSIGKQWTKPQWTGIYMTSNKDQNAYDTASAKQGAVDWGNVLDDAVLNAIPTKSISGVEYCILPARIQSATFTRDNAITVALAEAPTGSFMMDADGKKSEPVDGVQKVVLKSAQHDSFNNGALANGNAKDYSANVTVYIPKTELVKAATAGKTGAKITFSAHVDQYEIFEAMPDNQSKQPYLVCLPAVKADSNTAELTWTGNTDPTPPNPDEPGTTYGGFMVYKTAEIGAPLSGCTFEFKYPDPDTEPGDEPKIITVTKTTGTDGVARFDSIPEGVTGTLTETAAPAGYALVEPRSVTISGSSTGMQAVELRDSDDHKLTIRKTSTEDNGVLPNAIFKVTCISDGFTTNIETGADGTATLYGSDMPSGTYRVEEITAPNGYNINPKVETFTWNNMKDITIEYADDPKPGIRVVKIDGRTRVPLAGAVFNIMKNGAVVGSCGPTDVNGQVFVPQLANGYYEFVETVPPTGYQLDPTPHGINIDSAEFQENPIREFIITNDMKLKLKIIKQDAETQERLENFVFEIWHDGERLPLSSADLTTDANGEIYIEDLAPGTYTVKEVGGPKAYLIDAPDQLIELKVPVADEATPELIFQNTKKKGFIIQKIDSDTGEGLAGVVFEVWRDAQSIGYFTTGAGGYVTVSENALPGTYTVQEVRGPDGYKPNPTKYVVEHLAGEPTTVVVKNTQYKGFNVVKVDGETKKPLEGVVFEIWRNNLSLGEFTTDANGTITIENAPDGSYRVQEKKTLVEYILNDEILTVEHTLEDGTVLTVENLKKPGLLIKKVDETTGAPLAGAVFRITKADGTVVREQAETDSTGTIHLPELSTGDYIVTEIKAPDGYIISDAAKPVHLRENATTEITFTNTRKSGLLIKKVDANNRNKSLAGAIFKIAKSDGTIIKAEAETDAYGLINVSGLTPGAYIITEIRAPQGYVLDTNSKTVDIKANELTEVVFTNTKESGLLIQKIDAATKAPLSGAVFKIAKPDGTVVYPELRTDGFGKVSVHDLTEGDYVVTEIQAPAGYVVNEPSSKTVHVNGDSLISVTFEDSKKSGLLIKKVDASNNAALAGAVFSITKTDGTVVKAEAISDAAGMIQITDLIAGDYIVTETKAPNGYVIDTQAKTVTVRADSLTEVTFTNTKNSTAVIKKVDADTGDALAGAVFTITKPSGEVVASELTTGTNGLATLPELVAGSYIITEIKAPSGYIIDGTPKVVEIKDDTTNVFTFTNSKQMGMQIRKIDAETGEPLAGAKFSITKVNGERVGEYKSDSRGLIFLDVEPDTYVVTEISAPDGYKIDSEPHNVIVEAGKMATIEIENTHMASIRIKKIDAVSGKGIYGVRFIIKDESNNVIGEYTTDQDGYIELDGELTEGKYKVEEIRAADGYILDDTVRTLRVEAGKTTELVVENTPVLGQIQVVKKSSQANKMTHLPAGSVLEGAVFEITDADTGRVVDTITSDARGIAASNPIPLGRYFVQETKAPRFYQLNAEKLEVRLKVEGDVVRIEMLNDSADIKTTITKSGNRAVFNNDFMRYDFYNIANVSNVPLENFFWHDRLPTDAVRGQTITTGTYNERVWYSIKYKTNLTDYRVLADNLLSTNFYSFKIDSGSLKLMSGEYVTDIRYEFGTVPTGFRLTEKTTLYVYIPSYIRPGYKIINRADAGGQFQGEWDSSVSAWVTEVWQNGGSAPTNPSTGNSGKTLPKTGY